MFERLRFPFALLMLLLAIVGPLSAREQRSNNNVALPLSRLSGRWQVRFKMEGLEKHLILVSRPKGEASFLLQDTAPDDKPVTEPQPATWAELSNDRVSISGEVELPIGTCCREIGTLIFKGKFTSPNIISGKLIFVTSVDEEESPYQFRSEVGVFTATRIPD